MQLSNLDLNYLAILPEIITALMGVVIMLADAFSKNNARRSGPMLTVAGFGLAIVAVAVTWSSGVTTAFSGMVVVDPLRLFFSLILLICGVIATFMSAQFLDDESLPAGEFYALLMFSTTGMLMMASAGDLVMVFLGLEIASLATYVMAGYRRTDLRSNEAALKYFLLGAFSSAFLLYGMALTYGATGTTNVGAIRQAIASGAVLYPKMLLLGAALMLVGFGFKVATAPFHLWTPDVYEGAPTVVTAILATAPKIGYFAAFLRVFAEGFAPSTSAIGADLHTTWVTALAWMAAIGMTFGNIVALAQKNIKRMLAYSSIAHAGYTLIGFLTNDYAPVGFYMLTYGVMSLGAFAVIEVLSRRGDAKTEISDYAGIGFEVPGLSFPLAVFMLSLAGIPPTAGFMGKFYVFKSAWISTPELRWLVIVAIVNSIISVYYYLYPIVVMFFRPAVANFVKPHLSGAVQFALAVTLIGTLYLGLFPNGALNLLRQRPAGAQVVTGQVQR
jgi:NADH-quinone oxidoreductase subunit N